METLNNEWETKYSSSVEELKDQIIENERNKSSQLEELEAQFQAKKMVIYAVLYIAVASKSSAVKIRFGLYRQE